MESLEDGIATLAWGPTRLVDVDMAKAPLDLSLEPLVPQSQLLCVRLSGPHTGCTPTPCTSHTVHR